MLSRVQRGIVRVLLLVIGLLLLVLGVTCLWLILDHFRHVLYYGVVFSWSLLLSSGVWCVLGFWLGMRLLSRSLRRSNASNKHD